LFVAVSQEALPTFALHPSLVLARFPQNLAHVHRILTFPWIHVSALHVFLNMLAFMDAGVRLEDMIGTTPFVLLTARILVAQSVIMLTFFAALPRSFEQDRKTGITPHCPPRRSCKHRASVCGCADAVGGRFVGGWKQV
jgi:membrane associated rhomboid family serine protease